MNHPAKHVISAFHDGELNPEQRRQMQAHLAACAACRQELDGLRRLSRLLLAAAPQPAAGQAPAEAARRLARTLPAAPRAELRMPPAWGMLAAPLALIVAWAFGQAVFIAGAVLIVGEYRLPAVAQSLPGGPAAQFLQWLVAYAASLPDLPGLLGQLLSGLYQTLLSLGLPGVMVDLIGLGAWDLALGAAIGVLLWGWLLLWRRQARLQENPG